ncbi:MULTISPECIES: EI24 domain-containing protein [unclassified Polaribacter]|uniref:EI24 domain-containing protein n=1 Tax=unclassified Polaribacter TaxID=196858 RepID=UPI0011BFC18F|nr:MULTISPECIES: EI24 domain-containing protein [unclassified Polaribacter]TXD53619.1 EI24 domain-containing protein [Polaribacter sp. IC063]TXD62140.1 EI24 domain-containing protein [Polaribacter sp. IC066]
MIKNVILGIKEYAGAFALIGNLKLWQYFIIPILISIITFILIGFQAYVLSDNVGNFIAKVWIWDWGKETFISISNFIGGVVVFIIGLILYKHIIMALSAPFMSPVSEKIEFHLYGDVKHLHRKTSFTDQLIRGIKINVRNLSKELLITLPILLLKFIPIVNIFSTILLFLVQAYYAGFGNMDYTLERHLSYKESIKFVKKHKGFAVGNGIVFMLCLLVPIIGIIFVLPLSVTAASTKTAKLIHDKQELVDEK